MHIPFLEYKLFCPSFQQPPRSIANSFSSSITSNNNSSSRNQFIQNSQPGSSSTVLNNNINSNPVGGEFSLLLLPPLHQELTNLPSTVLSSLMASSANNALAQQQSSLATSSSSNNNNTTSSLSGHVTPTSAMFNNGGGGGLGQVGGIGSDRSQQQQMPIGGPNNPQGSVGQQNSSSLLGYRSFTNFSQVNARTSSMVRRSVLISRRSPSPEWPRVTVSLSPLYSRTIPT